MTAVNIEWDDSEWARLQTSDNLRTHLNTIGFRVTAHAIPHCGVDTGRLVASMTHGVEVENGELTLFCGSNAHDPSLQPVHYADVHWTGKKLTSGREARPQVRARRKQKSPKKTPTRPYSKALRELGLPAKAVAGGVES